MVSWGTAKTLLFTLGPLLLPRLISYVRSVRSSSNAPHAQLRPVPPRIRRSLNILFFSALLALISTLPYFAPEDLFTLTNSRLHIPTDVLFTRLSALRPLTPTDQILQQKLVSLESRLLYFAYGPDAIANCLFCNSDEPKSYLYFSIPSILAPYLLHIMALGLATSSTLAGKEASIWRTQATIAGAAMAFMEIYLLASYNHKLNLSSTRLSDIDFFHWKLRTYRGVGIAVVDAFLAFLLFLSSTNRAFVTPLSNAERLEGATRTLETANRKLHAMGITRNVVVRDDTLRKKTEAYWEVEGKLMGEVFEEREVVDGVRGALGRLNVREITEEAARYADNLVGGVQLVDGMAPPPKAR